MISLSELLVIGVLIVALIKPENLPEYAKQLGAAIKMIKQEVSEIKEPLQEAETAVKDAISSEEEVKDASRN